jgi:hypothetical protein
MQAWRRETALPAAVSFPFRVAENYKADSGYRLNSGHPHGTANLGGNRSGNIAVAALDIRS